MRSAKFLGNGRIEIEERPLPVPGPGELVVRVQSCALCGSERGQWSVGGGVTPGHEGAGVVADVGPGTSTPVGTRGSVYLVAYCGECRLCRSGSSGACLKKAAMLGFSQHGSYADYVLIPERCFLRLDDRLAIDHAVLLLDVAGTTLHAIRRSGLAPAQIEAAAVMGAGPIGLGSIASLKAVGVPNIVAVDVSPYRLALAERLGATAIDARAADVVAAIRERQPGGPPLVIEAAGNPITQRQAIDAVAPGGRVMIVGHSHQPLELMASRDLIGQEKALIGSEYFDYREHPDNQRLILEGRLDPLPIITHRFPLERIQEAFETFWSGSTGKVLVTVATD